MPSWGSGQCSAQSCAYLGMRYNGLSPLYATCCFPSRSYSLAASRCVGAGILMQLVGLDYAVKHQVCAVHCSCSCDAACGKTS